MESKKDPKKSDEAGLEIQAEMLTLGATYGLSFF